MLQVDGEGHYLADILTPAVVGQCGHALVDKTVCVYRLLVQGTLEEWIEALLSTKREMAQQIVGAAGERQVRWTRKDLMETVCPID